MGRKVNIITLGCSKNRVDSEHLMAQLAAAGYATVFDSEEFDSEVVIINTCGFIGDAKEESVEMILAAAEAKEEGLIEELYVVGCLSQRYAEELSKEIPEVDGYYGARGWEELIERLGSSHNEELETQRELSTPSHYAYLKISEGCDWRCGFCAIPLIRGRHRSVPIEALIEESQNLAAKGVKELIVVAQDSTFYGMDLYGERRLAQLLEGLCKVEGIEWIRLHYAYPAFFPDEVIEVMAREPKICKYLDIPFQHISDDQLKLMKRRHTRAEAEALITRLRSAIPDIAIRTTLLVGYPNESQQDYEQLVEFVSSTKFERLGVFPYCEEEGTFSATLEDNIPEQTKSERAERIMNIQSEISLRLNQERLGKQMRVIVDTLEGDYYIARSQYDSPEVDQEILIEATTELAIGAFYDVSILKVDEFDLFAQIVTP